MLTYPLNKESGRSLYEQLYEGIRRDILSGTLPAHQRLPSKRALAQHLRRRATSTRRRSGATTSAPWSAPYRRRPGSLPRCRRSRSRRPIFWTL